MKPVYRNILAVIAGLAVGSIVNMALVMAGSSLIPLPDGVDPNDMESFKANAHLFEPKHFLTPFLAHALGTLIGAMTAAFIAVGPKRMCAWIVGGFFLLGGVAAAFLIPAPAWFVALDLIIAYVPMAWLGHLLATRSSQTD